MFVAQHCVEATAPEDAARRIAAGLGCAERGAPQWVTAHVGARADVAPFAAALQAALFDGAPAKLHGGTSCLGVMGPDGPWLEGGRGAGVLAVWDRDGDYGVGATALGDDARAAGRRAAIAATMDAGRPGEAPDLVWLTASPGREEAVLEGIAQVVGTATPIVGGSAADNDLSGAWRVIGPRGAIADGVVVSALYPSTPLAFTYQSGYAPTGAHGLVTRAEGRRLLEIDGQPARRVFERWTSGRIEGLAGTASRHVLADSTWTPLGREIERVAGIPFHLLAHPASADADGGLSLFATIAEGERVHQMIGSSERLVDRAARLAGQTIRSDGLAHGAAGALVVFCGGSMLAMRESMDDVVSGLRRELDGVPFLGVFTFGEQGMTLRRNTVHGNLMISCVALGRAA